MEIRINKFDESEWDIFQGGENIGFICFDEDWENYRFHPNEEGILNKEDLIIIADKIKELEKEGK